MYNATGFGNTYVKQFAKIDFFGFFVNSWGKKVKTEF